MALSQFPWVAYLGASLNGFDPADAGPGLTNRQLIEALYVVWIVPWLLGLGIVVLAISGGWLRHTKWTLLGLTGGMLALTLVTYLIGSARRNRARSAPVRPARGCRRQW